MVVKPGPRFSVEDVANGWIKGLKDNGHEIVEFDLASRMQFFSEGFKALDQKPTEQIIALNAVVMLEGACWEHSPDVIVIISGFYLPASFYTHAKRYSKTVLMITESPYEDDWQLEAAKYVDMCVINDDMNLEKFNETTPTFYYGHGFDPDLHKPDLPDPELISQFCFVGTGYPERIEFFEQVNWNGINAVFGGNWGAVSESSPLSTYLLHDKDHCLDNKDTAKVYQSSLISANLYRKQASYSTEGNSCGPREIEMAACGLFFLREPRPESDVLFPDLPLIETPQNLHDQILYWLEHDQERQQIVEQNKKSIEHRTFDLLAEQFISDLKTI
jgi:spore maturation protein CgeB